MPLKSRSKFPPGGWQFFEPATGWSAPLPGVDGFDATVNKIIAHRRANPRFNLSVDFDTVADQLDLFTCHRIGFNPAYCETTEGQVKKNVNPNAPRGLRASLAKVVQGIKRSATGSSIMADWLGEGGQPVPIELANARANTCVTCPLNNMDNDWFFGIPKQVAVAIHDQLKTKTQLALKVDTEDQLGTCDACGCVLKLKTWTPIKHILDHTPKAEFDQLDARCWIRKER